MNLARSVVPPLRVVLLASGGVSNPGRLRAATIRNALHSIYTPPYRACDSERFG